MPGPCYCIFLGLLFFISPQWNFCALLKDEVLATEWGDPLGLSHRERVPLSLEWQRELQEVTPPEWTGHKQQVELQSIPFLWVPDFLGAPVLYRRLQCRSLVSNANIQLKIRLLGSTKNMYVEDSLHYCSFQTLLQVSGWLTVCLPENRVSCWLVQVPLFPQLAVSLLAHWVWNTCGISLCFEQSTSWSCIPVEKAPALLTTRHHMSHFTVILLQAGWAIVRKVLVGTAFRVSVQLDPSFSAVSQHLMLQADLRAADCKARGIFPKCS